MNVISDSCAGSFSQTDRITGCLVGLAVGDALGAPLEFLPRHQVRKSHPEGLRDMIASRLWSKSEYTDDTQMALLPAESLLRERDFPTSDVAQRFQSWARTAKDVGIQTRAVVNMAGYVSDSENCSQRYHAAHPSSSAGNGALMRCAPEAVEAFRVTDVHNTSGSRDDVYYEYGTHIRSNAALCQKISP